MTAQPDLHLCCLYIALDNIYSNTSHTFSFDIQNMGEVDHSTIVITSVINQSTVMVQSVTVYIQISQQLSLCTYIVLCLVANFMAATV